MSSPVGASPRPLARRLGLDGNPLRRASDRAEAWIRIGVLAFYLIAAPIVTVAAVHLTGHARVTQTSAQAAYAHGLRADKAMLLQPATKDASGRVTDPSSSGSFAVPPVITAVLTPLVLGLAFIAALSLARLHLNRRRLAGWEAAWSTVEPRWTGRP